MYCRNVFNEYSRVIEIVVIGCSNVGNGAMRALRARDTEMVNSELSGPVKWEHSSFYSSTRTSNNYREEIAWRTFDPTSHSLFALILEMSSAILELVFRHSFMKRNEIDMASKIVIWGYQSLEEGWAADPIE